MSRTTLYRVSLVLILVAVLSLASRPSWAGTGHPARPHSAPTQTQPAASLLGQAWNHLVSIWGRVGSVIDPNGNSIAANNGTPATTIQRSN